MSVGRDHINVCICTFKRPELLRRLLIELSHQRTDGLFGYSIIVADNDQEKSALPVIESFRQASDIDIRYCVEPEQNIARARNRAVECAEGNLIACIDDDEFPVQTWLFELFQAYCTFKADGILGPVLPLYETKPPKWIIKGKFHERPLHATGTELPWTLTRTGNVLFKRDLFDGKKNMFDPGFGSGGEDRDFFRRMIGQGRKFVWCAEAPVYETVPPERFKRSFLLRRALLRGKIAYNQNLVAYIKSLIIIPVYTVLLPFLFLIRHHIFMKYLIKYFDHIGRLLTLFGIDVVKQKYIVK
ncbi:MAG: glycosyltransferase family 2 protein [Nitrospirae bacterium]|nr:glycosyltransferase family 2 protein [Nitrospirota bacterium]